MSKQTIDKSSQLIVRQSSDQSNQQNSDQNRNSYFANFGQILNLKPLGTIYNMGCSFCKEISDTVKGVNTKSILESDEVVVEPKSIQTPRYTLVIEKSSTVSSGLEVEDRQTMQFGNRQSAEEYVSRVGLPIGCHYYIKDPQL